MDIYFFDLDRTLYAYDFRFKPPELARLSGVSQLRAAELGTVCLLSNNPSPLGEALPMLAPDVVDIMGGNILVSCMLGVRKPAPELYARALAFVGATARDAFFVDDSLGNVEGARAVGITAHHLEYFGRAPQTNTLMPAIEAFAERDR